MDIRHTSACRFALWSLVLAASMPYAAEAQEISDDWQFAATIYGWFPDIGGNTGFPAGADSTIDVDIATILDHLKMTAQGSFEMQKGRWGGFTDIVYLDVGATKSQTRHLEFNGAPLPAAVTADVDFDLKSTIWTFAASARLVASPNATVDMLLGGRLASFKQTLDWDFTGTFGPVTPPPLTGSREASVDQWDAIIGIKGRVVFGKEPQLVLPYYFDLGTGDSDATVQGMVGLGLAFHWGDVGVAWRYLAYDLKSGGAMSKMNFSGPAIGATFRW